MIFNNKYWTKFSNWFGFKPTTIPSEIHETTTAPVIPENYSPVDVENIIEETKNSQPVNLPSKYAVLIGINIYDPKLNANLNGCVNDVEAMHGVLTNIYKFPLDNIRLLTDQRATKAAIEEHINWLITTHTTPGDELFLHYSGHGSQVRDRNGDELDDQLDEILCPTDLDWDDPFTDDDLATLFKRKANGVNLTFVCDSCHSGSITRELANPSYTIPTELLSKARFIKPPTDILYRSIARALPKNLFGTVEKKLMVELDDGTVEKKLVSVDQKHVLLSGCRDDQTSADSVINGKWQGALTSSLIKSIKNNPNRDWSAIHAEIISILNIGGYAQRPQLSGNSDLIKGKNILGS